MLNRHAAGVRRRDVVRDHLLNTKSVESLLDVPELERIRGPRCYRILGRHDRGSAAGFHNQLGHVTAKVEAVIVEDHDVSRWNTARHQIVGREDRIAKTGDRRAVRATVSVAPPRCAGRQHHVRRAELQHFVSGDFG